MKFKIFRDYKPRLPGSIWRRTIIDRSIHTYFHKKLSYRLETGRQLCIFCSSVTFNRRNYRITDVITETYAHHVRNLCPMNRLISYTYSLRNQATPIRRVSKQRLFIRDLLFIERFTSSGDHGVSSLWIWVDMKLSHIDVEFSKSAMVIGIVCGCSHRNDIETCKFYKFPQINVHFKRSGAGLYAISFAHQCSFLMHLLS